jgi:hypothetical protein
MHLRILSDQQYPRSKQPIVMESVTYCWPICWHRCRIRLRNFENVNRRVCEQRW